MHKKFLLFLTTVALLITGCGKKPKDISDLKNATPADSMMFYFGELQAANYWQDAETDTTLRTEEGRADFMKGFRAAMNMDEDNSAYNKGLQLGLRLALRLREFKERYGVEFSESLLASSLEAHINKDTSINLAEAQKGYYKIKDRFELQTAEFEVEKAKVNLAKHSRSNGYEMISDTLYAKDVTPGANGPKFKDGDRVAVEVTACTLEGKEIVTRQFPDSITIGTGRVPTVVRLGIHTMTNGQTRSFMTTPRTLFGKRYAIYKLPYDEPVIFTVKAEQN